MPLLDYNIIRGITLTLDPARRQPAQDLGLMFDVYARHAEQWPCMAAGMLVLQA